MKKLTTLRAKRYLDANLVDKMANIVIDLTGDETAAGPCDAAGPSSSPTGPVKGQNAHDAHRDDPDMPRNCCSICLGNDVQTIDDPFILSSHSQWVARFELAHARALYPCGHSVHATCSKHLDRVAFTYEWDKAFVLRKPTAGFGENSRVECPECRRGCSFLDVDIITPTFRPNMRWTWCRSDVCQSGDDTAICVVRVVQANGPQDRGRVFCETCESRRPPPRRRPLDENVEIVRCFGMTNGVTA